jgi:drug/metabolite transporter (DMT)-like permease
MTFGAAGAVAVLGVVGTGVAYALNFSIVRDAGPAVASTVTYLLPIVSTVAGVVLLGDRVGWWQPTGAVIILVGAAIVQGRIPRRPRVRAVVTVEGAAAVQPSTTCAANG